MKRTCIQCGKEFELSNSEIGFYKKRKLSLPKRCKECRDKNKKAKQDGSSEKPEQKRVDFAGTKENPSGKINESADTRNNKGNRKMPKLAAILICAAAILYYLITGQLPQTDVPKQDEISYTFRSEYVYDWTRGEVRTRWQKKKLPEQSKVMKISDRGMDPVSLYFNLRSIDASTLSVGQTHNLEMVLEDTVKVLKYRLLGREVCRVPQQGKFRTIKLACTLGTSEGFSFTDGSEFFIWITDDKNKFPVMLESPIKIGSIRAYISDFKGLKYPLTSKIR